MAVFGEARLACPKGLVDDFGLVERDAAGPIVQIHSTLQFHQALSVVFFGTGALLCFGLVLLAGFANAFGGMGDGAASSRHIDSRGFAILFGVYFACGGLASLIPLRPVRVALGIVAHISPSWAVLCGGARGGVGDFVIFAVLALIVYGVFSMAWVHMIKDHVV